MSSIFEDSKTDLYVIRVDNGAALRSALTAGMGGFYVTGTNAVPVVAALTAGVEYEYCHRNTAGALLKTTPFKPEQLANATYMLTTARANQVSYLGYNGVSGAMDAAINTYYGLKVSLDHTFGMLNNSPLMKTIPYKSGATNTQHEMAENIAEVFNGQFGRDPFRSVVADAVTSVAVDATQLVDHNVTVVNGSAVINVATNLTYQAAAHTFVVGDFLRIGSATKTIGGGTALTSAVYRVTAINALAVTLDRPVTVASGLYAQATADVEVIESATGIAADWGLRFDGVSVADASFNPVYGSPFVSSFTLEAGDFTTATPTYTTGAFEGRGTFQQVAYEEAYTQFQNRTREISSYPATSRNIEAQAGETYAIFTFDVLEQDYIDAVTGKRPISKNRIRIAMLTALVAAEGAEYLTVLGSAPVSIATGNPA